jgi:hypothetical protein
MQIVRKRKCQLYMAFFHKRFKRVVDRHDQQDWAAAPNFDSGSESLPVAVDMLVAVDLADARTLTNAGDEQCSRVVASDLTPAPAAELDPAPAEPEALACNVRQPTLQPTPRAHVRRSSAGQRYPAKAVNKVSQSTQNTPVRDRCTAARTSADVAVDPIAIRNLLQNMSSAMSLEVEKQNAYVDAQKLAASDLMALKASEASTIQDETACEITLGFFDESNACEGGMAEFMSDLEL